jgi:ubiquinone/menaquinone biosynthesis C-methylase UbiE/biotin operon repressor
VNRTPAADFERLYALGTGFQASKIIFTAVRLGIFSALDNGPVSGKYLAARLHLSPDALLRFMRALKSMGLIAERGGSYTKTALSRRYLGAAAGQGCEDLLAHLETLESSWAHLAYSLRRGTMRQPQKKALARYPRQLARFLDAMHASGTIKSAAIAETLQLQKYSRMLDVGGGRGTYAVCFARKNINLQATVFDLASVVPHAKKYIRQCRLDQRISTVSGECLADPFPEEDYDLVLLSNILHIYAAGEARAIIKKAVQALQRGGTLLVHDYITGLGDQVFVALFDMAMLTGTPEGRCHGRTELYQWMKKSGIIRIKTKAVNAGTSIVWGIKDRYP